MLVEKLSRIFGKEEKGNERAEELHQRLTERLGREERKWVLALIDEKDRERLEAQEENFRRGFKLGLRLGREMEGRNSGTRQRRSKSRGWERN